MLKRRIRAFVKKDLHCTRIFDSADRFTPDSFLQSQLELARASANFGAEIVLPVKIKYFNFEILLLLRLLYEIETR